jgi:hypothetical protein
MRPFELRRRLLLAMVCVLSWPAPTTAQEAEPSGAGNSAERTVSSSRRFLIGGAINASWSNDGASVLGALKSWQVSGTPSVSYFVRDRIGAGLHVGGGASQGVGTTRERTESFVLAGVHGVFDLQLAKRVSLLLWPALGYVHEWARETPYGAWEPTFGGGVTSAGATFQQQSSLASALRRQEIGYVRAALTLPLTFRLSPSVAIGFGPEMWFDFIVRRVPDYGTTFQQLPSSSDEAPSPAERYPAPARRRFQVGLSTMLVIAI